MFVSLYQSLNKTQKAARKLLREYIISIMIGLPKTLWGMQRVNISTQSYT